MSGFHNIKRMTVKSKYGDFNFTHIGNGQFQNASHGTMTFDDIMMEFQPNYISMSDE